MTFVNIVLYLSIITIDVDMSMGVEIMLTKERKSRLFSHAMSYFSEEKFGMSIDLLDENNVWRSRQLQLESIFENDMHH